MTRSAGRLPEHLGWIGAIRQPADALAWTLEDWQRIVPLARRLRLLARLAASLDGAGLLEQVPEPPRRHLIGEQRLSRYRTSAMTWALERARDALRGVHCPCVLLKGAAYVGQGLPIASGRMPSDVDILVPRAHLDQAQAALKAAGWKEIDLDAHDQRYYREWSHELPPMRHAIHPIELDVHHNILPPVARTRVDANLLLERLTASTLPGWQVLHPADQILHSAAHLFLDSETRDRVRDLVDLDGLLRHFGRDGSLWEELPARAAELGLTEPLALACRFCVDWMGTPIPEVTLERIDDEGPGRLVDLWLVPLLRLLLTPADPLGNSPGGQRAAASIFLARYHLNRLPVRMLVPHVWHKLRASAG